MAEELSRFLAADPQCGRLVLIRGLYYEGWDPTGKPQKVRHKAAFLTPIREHFQDDWDVDPEEVARVVLKVLTQHVSDGEIADIKHLFPIERRELWP